MAGLSWLGYLSCKQENGNMACAKALLCLTRSVNE